MKRILGIVIISILAASLAKADVTTPNLIVKQTKAPDIFSLIPADKATLYHQKDVELKAKYLEINNKIKAATMVMDTILTNEPFNQEAYTKKADEVRKLQEEKYNIRIDAITELAGQFNAEQRRVLANAFQEITGSKFRRNTLNKQPK